MMLDKVAKAEHFVVGIVKDIDCRVADAMCGCAQLLDLMDPVDFFAKE